MKHSKDFWLHVLMCVIGGFIGCYSLIRCHEQFAAAQTANLIYAIKWLLGGDFKEFFLRILGLLFYAAGIESYVLISHKTTIDPQKWLVCVQIALLCIIAFLPEAANFHLCLYCIFYFTAAQWSVFHGACGFTASTIFSSNNVRQLSLALGEYLCDHKAEQAKKARFFGATLASYHIGVAAALLSFSHFNQMAILFCLIPTGMAAFLIFHTYEKTLQPVARKTNAPA